MTYRWRSLWLKVHLWLGLSAGLLLVLAGLTGSLIVFDHALDEWLNADRMLSRQQGEWRPLREILLSARQSSAATGEARSIACPRTTTGVFTVTFSSGPKKPGASATEVFVDPVTAEVLGSRIRGSGGVAWVYRLHATLLAGHVGETVMGGLAILVLVSVVSGVILWWSLLKAGWRAALAIRRQKFNFDLHKTAGIFITPILLLVAWSGTHLTLPWLVRPVVTLALPESRVPQNIRSRVPSAPSCTLDADNAVAVAQGTWPGCRVMSVELPVTADETFRVFVRQEGEVGSQRGVGRLWVDQYSGEVLATRDWNKLTLADTYFRIQLELHNGDAFGLVGRWAYVVAGVVPLGLYVTGFALWWRKRASRRRQLRDAARRNVSPTVPHEQALA